MSTLVVDANVVLQSCIDAGGLGPLTGYDLVAPPIMRSEATSSLHEMRFRGDISQDLAERALGALQALEIPVESPSGFWERSWQVAGLLGWAKTYDAEYVALAQLLDCRLVTLDARLARGASRLAQIVGPADI